MKNNKGIVLNGIIFFINIVIVGYGTMMLSTMFQFQSKNISPTIELIGIIYFITIIFLYKEGKRILLINIILTLMVTLILLLI